MNRTTTRWRRVGRFQWCMGLRSGEYWIGTRYSFVEDAWLFGFFGVILVVGRHG